MIRTSAVACVCVLSATWLGAVPAQAQPATAPLTAASQLVQTFKVDLDGDGRKDTVKAYHKGSGRYSINVRTARGRKATRTLSADPISGKPIYAAAGLDKAKGRELILTVGDGDGWDGQVLTWRKGRLVTESAPAAYDETEGTYFRRWAMEQPTYVLGYRFFSAAGKRYCDTTWYDLDGEDDLVTGSVVRSVWKSNAWKRLSRKVATPVDYDSALSKDGFSGVQLTKP